MENTVNLTEQLQQEWRDLGFEVLRERKLNFDAFNSTFSQTYSVLSEYSSEISVDKKYLELVAEAFLFANIRDDSLGNVCLAAFVLTERMLTHCAFTKASAAAAPSTVYDVEARRDIVLDFTNVNDSISKLEKFLDGLYPKKS